MNNNHLRAETVFSSVRWTSFGQIAGHLMQMGVSVALARLLDPKDFGLLSMALVITGFMTIFQYLGTNAVVIQKKELSSKLMSSLFVINVAIGITFTGSLALFGPIIAKVYKTSQVAPVIQILGLTFLITSFGILPSALLNRKMMFNRLVQIELTCTVIQGTVVILLAYMGWKVWALVVAGIINSTVSTCLLCLTSGWSFQWGFNWSEVRNVMRFSLDLTAANIVGYSTQSIDKFIIGRFLGAGALGYYSMAYKMYMKPMTALSSTLSRVLFPAFSRMQEDEVRLGSAFLRAISGIALIIFPMMMGLFVVSRPFVLGVLGEKWSPCIPLIMIFALIGILHSITKMSGNIYLAKGRSGLFLWWQIGSGAIIIISFLCGIPWGIVGVASAYAIVIVPLSWLSVMITVRLINVLFVDFLVTLLPYAGASVAMAGVVMTCRLLLEHWGLGPLLVVCICVPLGMVIYTSIILFLHPAAIADIVKLFPGKAHKIRLWLSASVEQVKSIR